jgi:hypothetical protein
LPAQSDRLFDPVRRKSVAAKPEEKIRQALTRWLLENLKVPPRLASVEYSLSALDPSSRKRADIVVWQPGSRDGGLRPWLLAECKAPGISLDDRVADQVRRYAEKIHAEFVLITNGELTRYFRLGQGRYEEIERLPSFSSIKNVN